MKNPTPRQQRHISYLSQFDINIQFISGSQNVVADCFSRVEIAEIEFETLFSNDILSNNAPSNEDLAHFKTNPYIHNGVYMDLSIPGCPRPILAGSLRLEAFNSIHNLTRAGHKATYSLLHTKVVWPFMRKDVKFWCNSCASCQSNKITRHTKPPILSFPTGSRFETVHIDIVGPLPPSRGYTYRLTMIDRKTRWPEVFPIRNINADTVVEIFVNNWVSRFGVPKRIITDQGRQFESKLFQSLLKRLGCQKLRTTAFHPQSNGLVERFHRTLKNSLRSATIVHDWTSNLPYILLGWRNIPSSRYGASPAQLVFGSNTYLVNDLFFGTAPSDDNHLNLVRDYFAKLDTTNKSFNTCKIYIPSNLLNSKFVWLLRESPTSLQSRYAGPYRVISFNQDYNTATISVEGKMRTVNLSKLKPSTHVEDTNLESVHLVSVKKKVTFATWTSTSGTLQLKKTLM